MNSGSPFTSDAKSIYKEALGYIYTRMEGLRRNNRFEIGPLYDLAGRIVASSSAAIQLDTFAIYYYDLTDIALSHAVNVAILAVTMARGMGYSPDRLTEVCAAGLIHDIGIARIDPAILDKEPEKLTSNQRHQVKAHPKYGHHAVIETYRELEPLAGYILQHHERVDGSGYPYGIKLAEMDEIAQIIALIDTFEALIHPRNRRDALVPPIGIKQILTNEGSAFPKHLLKTLIDTISIYPVGCIVRLNSGEIARVIQISHHNPLRPVVRVTHGPDGRPVTPKTIDLKNQTIIYITGCLPSPDFRTIA